MSDLRARLKKISERPPEEAAPVAPPSPCRLTGEDFDIPFRASEAEMRLLGGCGVNPLFLDTETTGLMGGAGTLAFLVGVGYFVGGRLRVEQYYMSDYDQEEDMLGKIEERLRAADVLVTYNGKSFDVPLLRSRFVMARKPSKALELPHIDLLHGARRVFRRRLQKCSLTDIEQNVLGIHREGDLPGRLVPEYWFGYLKNGDQRLMDEILRHNLQDIASLGLLLNRLCEAYRAPEALSHQLDLFSVGLAMERMGEGTRAVRFLSAAGGSDALYALARIHRRGGRYDEAIEALSRGVRNGGSVALMVELAKIEEHRRRDIDRALAWTDAAIAAATNAAELEPLVKRRMRLTHKKVKALPHNKGSGPAREIFVACEKP